MLPADGQMTLAEVLPLAHKAAARYEMSLAFVLAIMRTESNFNAKALSAKGAVGLMQLMPATARDMGVKDRHDPEQNVMGGVAYLRHISQVKLPGASMLEVAAAYNAGPERVKASRNPKSWPDETQEYVRRVAYHFVRYTGVRV